MNTAITATESPLRHVSIRVPWHDAGWTGTFCRAPHLNGACAGLKSIAYGKREAAEMPLAGQSLENVAVAQWPCCIQERAGFMAPFAMTHLRHHALAGKNAQHYGHFKPTRQPFPPYSAGIVPFRWLMRENIDAYAEKAGVSADLEREPELGYEAHWVHEAENQRALLDGFTAHLAVSESLCLFYAKHVPFYEGTARILIGVGRVKSIGALTEFDRSDPKGMRGMIWERPVQHTIRPQGRDGFLLPYHPMLERAAEEPSLDVTPFVAHAPEEHWGDFSYGSELVTHDGAIGALLSIDAALVRFQADLGIETDGQREWVRDELVRLWKVRGPYPGLGAVLSAFGLSRGLFVAHALQEKAGRNADPWPLVEDWFERPTSAIPKESRKDHKELAPTWKKLAATRKKYLKLLSRFELSIDQARDLYDADRRRSIGLDEVKDTVIVADPYVLYRLTRHRPGGIALPTIDRGLFPDDTVRRAHPLPEPSGLDSAVDLRRVTAFAIQALERAADGGHTLLPIGRVVSEIAGSAMSPACPVTGDILRTRAEDMGPEVVALGDHEPEQLQLERYASIRELARKHVEGRIKSPRHLVPTDWPKLLAAKFPPSPDPEEACALSEKAAALRELAESRLTVLIGPAGSGKTTVLGLLCSQPAIRDKGLLLLAPTGKARVRMQQLVGGSVRALTVAQFLNQHGRYDGESGRYHLSPDRPKASGHGTVIVDEASMLTEDMLGALLDALQGVERLILVGDPAQLPPIGAGRPFVDVVTRLRPEDIERRFPRVAAGYAELTIERRQTGDRPDLRLARWFGNAQLHAGEDEAFLVPPGAQSIETVEWNTADDFRAALQAVLRQTLKLQSTDDARGFNASLGATTASGYDYFNSDFRRGL